MITKPNACAATVSGDAVAATAVKLRHPLGEIDAAAVEAHPQVKELRRGQIAAAAQVRTMTDEIKRQIAVQHIALMRLEKAALKKKTL